MRELGADSAAPPTAAYIPQPDTTAIFATLDFSTKQTPPRSLQPWTFRPIRIHHTLLVPSKRASERDRSAWQEHLAFQTIFIKLAGTVLPSQLPVQKLPVHFCDRRKTLLELSQAVQNESTSFTRMGRPRATPPPNPSPGLAGQSEPSGEKRGDVPSARQPST
jgi:hypothetical protein